MLKSWMAAASLALLLSVGAAHSAIASVVDFHDVHPPSDPTQSQPPCVPDTTSHQGMSFGVGYACFYGPAADGTLADFPFDVTSTVMAATVWPIDGVGMTIDANAAEFTTAQFDPGNPWPLMATFNLQQLDIALGPDPDFTGWTSGKTTIMAYDVDGHVKYQTEVNLTRSAFSTISLNWTDIVGVNFSAAYQGDYAASLAPDAEHYPYIGLDNIYFTGAPTPEPAAWGLMLLGFGGIGAVLRAARRRNLALAA